MAFLRFSSGLDPVSALMTLQRELDRVFENPSGFDLGVSSRGVFPPVNVFSNREGYIVKAEVPGIPPEQIEVKVSNQTLTISGKRVLTAPSGGGYHRRERDEGEFSRSLRLPADLDGARAEASCKNGLLTIHIPKKQEALPREITVKAA